MRCAMAGMTATATRPTRLMTVTATIALPHTAVTHARLIHGWRRGAVVSGVRRINEVNPRRARLVSGPVTVFGRV